MTKRLHQTLVWVVPPLLWLTAIIAWWWIWRTPKHTLRASPARRGSHERALTGDPTLVGDRPPKPDDLTRIEGIGPKTMSVLREAGIVTFGDLARASAEQLDEVLKAANIPLAFPATWPEQAALAAVDAWHDLERLQASLHRGRRVER
jgi:predicted flap endonuclease-1-like 5' DNA nuclease